MGITTSTAQLLERAIKQFNPKNVGEYGSQNLYLDGMLENPYANIFYEKHGIEYTCFDLSKENNCLVYDLTFPLPAEFNERFDMVTDIGCTEHYGREGKHHMEGLYISWLNKHSILKNGGVMVNENPESGSWPLHGFNYYTEEFYRNLCAFGGYEIIELGRQAAMGNITDGWNVYCVLKKISNEFITLEEFKTLGIKLS